MLPKITASGGMVVAASLPVYYYKSDKCVIAECRPLGIRTFASSLAKAKKMFAEAFELWCIEVQEAENLDEVLLELGWTLTKTSAKPKDEVFKVPMNLLANASVNINVQLAR